ncbi:MAG: hypothetical protein J6L94_03530, partial [Acidaminococcaceae bacterium]|nr:hypothetical protein [Acidaminococcaceae bacterium]
MGIEFENNGRNVIANKLEECRRKQQDDNVNLRELFFGKKVNTETSKPLVSEEVLSEALAEDAAALTEEETISREMDFVTAEQQAGSAIP